MSPIKDGDWVEILVPMPTYQQGLYYTAKWKETGDLCQVASIVHDSVILEFTADDGMRSRSCWRSAFDVRKLSPLEVLAQLTV